MENNNPAK